MQPIHSLVAKILTELPDFLQAADDQPLEVQLIGNPQIQIGVELVVMRDKRHRRAAAVQRLQDRSLDLDKPLLGQELPDDGDDAGTELHRLADVGVDDQVDIALAVAGLLVGQAMIFFRQRVKRFGEKLKRIHGYRLFAGAGDKQGAGQADDIPQVKQAEQAPQGLADGILFDIPLQSPELILEMEEGRFPHDPNRHDPSGQRYHGGLFRQRIEVAEDLLGRVGAVKSVRKRVYPYRFELLQLLQAVGDDLVDGKFVVLRP